MNTVTMLVAASGTKWGVSDGCVRKGWGGRVGWPDGGHTIRLYGIYHTSIKTRL